MAWGDNDTVAGWGSNDPVASQPKGYGKARQRVAETANFARENRKKFGVVGNVLNAVGDWQTQVVRNTGAFDEVAGGINYAMQGVENVGRRLTGKEVEIPASTAYKAASDYEREQQAAYARANPAGNALATGAAILTTGRPTGAAAIRNPLAAGAAATAQNLPFAFARQEGNAMERLPGVAKESAITFGVGSALTAGANALSKSAAASKAVRSPARKLSDEGVNLTPGQMAGGFGKRLEDVATSAPMTGAAINARRTEGLADLNVAGYNRALEPIGRKAAPGAGRDAVKAVHKEIRDAYNAALNGVTVAPDQQFQSAVGQIVNNSSLPPNVAQELDAVVNNTILGQFSGAVDGQTWKSIDEELGSMVRAADNASANQPTQRYLRDALKGIKDALGGALERVNPQAYAAVKQADEAFANFARIRQGAQAIGAEDGVMTAAQMLRASQAMDTSAGNVRFAEGDALMQDLAEAGKKVLPNKVPDSGTPIRLATGAGIFGGLSGAISPGAAMTAAAFDAAGAVAYSKPVMDVLNAVYRAKSPGAARQALATLQTLAARNPALVPEYEKAAQMLGVLPQPSSGQPSRQGYQPVPTTP